MERVLLLLSIGAVGGLFARRINMPGGSLLGAMLTTGAVSLAIADSQPLPAGVRSVALLLLGIYTGSSMKRQALARVRAVLPAAMVTILLLIAVALGLGWVLYYRSAGDVSLATTLLGTMPGGASGLAAAAYDLGADAHLVASMHMVRLIMVFGFLPLVLRGLAGSGIGRGDPKTGGGPGQKGKAGVDR